METLFTVIPFLCLCGVFWLIKDHIDTVSALLFFIVVVGLALSLFTDIFYFLGMTDLPSGIGSGNDDWRY